MIYDTSSQPVLCGSCEMLIPPGMPIYRVTRANLPRCSSCAAKTGAPLPELPHVTQAPKPLDFSRFRKADVGADLRHRILDQRRAGSE